MNPVQIFADTWNLSLIPGGVDAESMLLWHVWLTFWIVVCLACAVACAIDVSGGANTTEA